MWIHVIYDDFNMRSVTKTYDIQCEQIQAKTLVHLFKKTYADAHPSLRCGILTPKCTVRQFGSRTPTFLCSELYPFKESPRAPCSMCPEHAWLQGNSPSLFHHQPRALERSCFIITIWHYKERIAIKISSMDKTSVHGPQWSHRLNVLSSRSPFFKTTKQTKKTPMVKATSLTFQHAPQLTQSKVTTVTKDTMNPPTPPPRFPRLGKWIFEAWLLPTHLVNLPNPLNPTVLNVSA